MRALYTLLAHLILPFLPLRLWWRARREPAYGEHIAERFGCYQALAPDARPILWVHAVSLGETRAAQPLVARLHERLPGYRLLITHMTATGRRAGEDLFPDALIAYLPYDLPWAARRFLQHFRPAIGVLMETEVWPNLIAACAQAQVPLVLANARLSARSAAGYQRTGSLARNAFAGFDRIAAQTDADARRLSDLGARNVRVTGNIKFDASMPPQSLSLAQSFRGHYGARSVLLLASTREGEERLILDAIGRAPLPPELLVVVVPRHPQRFDAVAALIEANGHALVRRSGALDVPAEVGFVLGDSLGEMAAYYSASDIAFVGGSLVPVGGQNLIEACAAGVPVLIGPSQFNFAQAASDAIAAGALIEIADADALLRSVRSLLAEPLRRAQIAACGLRFAQTHQGAATRTADLVIDALTASKGTARSDKRRGF